MIELPADLLNFLRSEEQRSNDTSLNEERKIALDFYHGRPFGDEVKGRSQLVTRDVAEAVDNMLKFILRTVLSERVVEFEARSVSEDDIEQPQMPEGVPPEQAQAVMADAMRKARNEAGRKAQDRAEDATEFVSWQFLRSQPGGRILHDWIKAGLLEKTGIAKTWVEETWDVTESYATAVEVENDDTIIAAEPEEGMVAPDPVTGDAIQVYRVKRRVKGKPKFLDAAVPNEEFRFSPDARDLDSAGYIQHRTRKSLAQVMATFDLQQAEAETLWSSASDAQSLSDTRDQGKKRDSDTSGSFGMSRLVWLNEEYVRWDWNGDGSEELLCIHRVGDKVLSAVEVEEQPFSIWCPYPMQHRIVGESLADKTMDIQRIRSVLLRQAMDALYFANTPRVYIDESQSNNNTLDDYLSIMPGSPIRGRGPNAVQFLTQPFAAPQAFTALEFMTSERESRTGITRHNQGLNADSLNKTATGYKIQSEDGAVSQEFVAQMFADSLAELFEKKLRLMKRNGAVESLRVGGEFKTLDASEFDDDMGMGIRVGLGSGRKDARLGLRMQLLDMQKEAFQVGSSLVDEEKIYNSVASFVEDAQLGDPNMYWNDPAQSGEQKGDRKDPATMEAEGKLALQQSQQQFDQDKAKAQHDLDVEKARAAMDLARGKAELDNELARDRAAMEADLAERKFAFEQNLAERRMIAELAMRNAPADGAVPQDRPGGRLDA